MAGRTAPGPAGRRHPQATSRRPHGLSPALGGLPGRQVRTSLGALGREGEEGKCKCPEAERSGRARALQPRGGSPGHWPAAGHTSSEVQTAPVLGERWAPLWKGPSSHCEILPRGEHGQKEGGSPGGEVGGPPGNKTWQMPTEGPPVLVDPVLGGWHSGPSAHVCSKINGFGSQIPT